MATIRDAVRIRDISVSIDETTGAAGRYIRNVDDGSFCKDGRDECFKLFVLLKSE